MPGGPASSAGDRDAPSSIGGQADRPTLARETTARKVYALGDVVVLVIAVGDDETGPMRRDLKRHRHRTLDAVRAVAGDDGDVGGWAVGSKAAPGGVLLAGT